MNIKKLPIGRKGNGQVLLSRSKWGNIGVFLFLLIICAFMALPMVCLNSVGKTA